MSPRISSPAHPSGGGAVGAGNMTPGRGRGGGLSKRDRELIGQTVRIVQGPFKGIDHQLFIIIQMLCFLEGAAKV